MKKFLILMSLTLSLNIFGQDGPYKVNDKSYSDTSVEMADVMRSNGKIYVVVGVIMIILAGLIIYLFNTDRKITRIEREVFREKINS